MQCTRNVTDHVIWVGANDRRLNLFENLFPIPISNDSEERIVNSTTSAQQPALKREKKKSRKKRKSKSTK